MESLAAVEDVLDTTPAVFSAFQPGVDSTFQVLAVVMTACFFVKGTSSNVLEDMHELESCSGLF